ncbi:pyrroloquinoline quinone biosynthesis peptide chaperone PqqD [Limibaculum sp. M0105]|uniref:Pyrroloquinoline quinone biosynthesis peptide chaperone PqqD n=1 Tax=Thermohalobaculum xanthum TaxID=2753746 RepID=A0A8J7M7Y5_9RHOB|nr:pyrroloquinoline quinone biosynthesis peptide chaperone PqqD [Thermohalobaculum xanthum]MBK0399865.1 pyrroloquinoline quinone biosynthesis peptide chaperone PqqD [Thermohalobaculum xanthum]
MTAPAATLPETARPRLLRGVRTKFDRVRDTWVLLAPERTLKLDQIGHAILSETNGERSFGEIVDRLAATYNAPRDRIAEDAGRFLASLIDRRMAEAR